MNQRKFIHYLLYKSLLIMREEGKSTGNKKVFWISDLLHNLPLQLEQANTDQEVKAIFEELLENAEHKDLKRWLESMMEDYSNYLNLVKSQERKKSE